MMYMKRYSILLILLLLGTIGLNAQVQDRFKTKQKSDSTQEQQVTDEEDVESKPRPKANTTTEEDFWDKVVIGGSVSLSFGTTTFIYLAPTVGYKFTDNLIAGPGFIYQYTKFNQITQGNTILREEFESSIYGPKAFFNYILADRFIVGAHFEYLNHTKLNSVTRVNQNGTIRNIFDYENIWTPILFLEAGLMNRLGDKGFVQVGLRYNVLHDPNTSPYGSAFFPVVAFYF